MPTMLEVEPEVVAKIQLRARARGVSVDVYLQEWASSHSTNTPHLSDDAINRERIYG
jgi:hypothetical protein